MADRHIPCAWLPMSRSNSVRELIKRAPITTSPTDPLSEAYRLMREHDVSQLPVLDGDRIAGIVDESDILLHVYGDPKRFNDPVSIAMVTRLELTPADASLETLLPIFERGHVAMVAEDGKLTGLITRVDLLDWLGGVAERFGK